MGLKIHKGTLGAIFWVSNAQYYLLQLIVAADWPKHQSYSWTHNTLSDLANTACGRYGDRAVCSPLHNLMNLSFIVLGFTIIGGAILLGRKLVDGRIGRLGLMCMALSGIGTIIIGLSPENSSSFLHTFGATLAFALGNAGMLLIGFDAPRLPAWLKRYGMASGLIGLAALALFLHKLYLGTGIGGMERIVAYPQSLWMIVAGAYLLLTRRN